MHSALFGTFLNVWFPPGPTTSAPAKTTKAGDGDAVKTVTADDASGTNTTDLMDKSCPLKKRKGFRSPVPPPEVDEDKSRDVGGSPRPASAKVMRESTNLRNPESDTP